MGGELSQPHRNVLGSFSVYFIDIFWPWGGMTGDNHF
jgi:hypothetical protein